MNAALSFNDWSFLVHEDQFTLNLSHSSLIECIDRHTDAKAKFHRSIGQQNSTLKYHLGNLQDALNMTLFPKHITSIFYDKFVSFLEARGLMLTSIKKMCEHLRAILSWASDYKAEVHPSYKTIDIEVLKVQQVVLSADDVSRIYHFDLEHAKIRPQHRRTLEAVRDMFVLGCNLGQRHSDLVRIDKGCFVEGRFQIVQQKTKNLAVVDLRRMAIDMKTTKQILEKYNYTAPYKSHLTKYDLHIHQLMHIVFGEEKVVQPIVSGNLVTSKEVYKYEAIASHTARRSFATHNYRIRQFPAVEVMRATGHTSEGAFRKYIICGEDD